MKTKTQSQDITFVNPYIFECINSEAYYVNCNKEDETEAERLQFLYDTFVTEYWYDYNKKYYHNNIYNAFASWLQGLPSSFNIDFANYRILEIAKEWGSLAIDATEKQEDKILANWWNFISIKTFHMFKKYKIDQHSN